MMQGFKEKARNFYFHERHADIDAAKFMEMPEERSAYDLSRVIGNVNLSEGRFRTRKEANVIIDRFLAAPLP